MWAFNIRLKLWFSVSIGFAALAMEHNLWKATDFLTNSIEFFLFLRVYTVSCVQCLTIFCFTLLFHIIDYVEVARNIIKYDIEAVCVWILRTLWNIEMENCNLLNENRGNLWVWRHPLRHGAWIFPLFQ